MDDIEKRLRKLAKLREDIDYEKSELNKKEGKRQSIMERLKREFNMSSIDEATKKANLLKAQLERRSIQLEKDLEELEKNYEF